MGRGSALRPGRPPAACRLSRLGFTSGTWPTPTRSQATLTHGAHINIIGAGFIGCEVAAAAIAARFSVRVYETLAHPLVRVLGPQLGAYIADVHRSHRLGRGRGRQSTVA